MMNPSRRNDPLDASAGASTVPIPASRASGPLTPSSMPLGSHRVYCDADGMPKPITRPCGPDPAKLPCDPLAGQPHAQCPTTVIRCGADAQREARHRLRTTGKVHMTTTAFAAGAVPSIAIHVTIAGRVLIAPDGKPIDICYFSAGGDFRQGNFAGLWGMVTRQWPELRDAVWAFASFAVFDADCWARVEAAWRQMWRADYFVGGDNG